MVNSLVNPLLNQPNLNINQLKSIKFLGSNGLISMDRSIHHMQDYSVFFCFIFNLFFNYQYLNQPKNLYTSHNNGK